MPKKEIKLNVFVASPSDVIEERNLINNVCDELNRVWGDWLGLNLNLIRWETNIHPGVSAYSQNVINEQVDNNFDIFIAMFWNRFGTPTKKAKSGTLEELEIAFNKFNKANHSIDIMIYFKDQLIDFEDKNQQEQVLNFKKTLPEKGTLYWEYTKTKDFESLIRIHLSMVAQKWAKKHSLNNINKTNINLGKDVRLRLYDYYYIVSGKAGTLSVLHANIIKALELFINSQNKAIVVILPKNTSNDVRLRALDLFAIAIEDVTNILDSQILLLEKTRSDFFELLSKLVSVEIGLEFSPRLDEIVNIITPWIKSHPDAIKEIQNIRDKLNIFPDATEKFSVARYKLLSFLGLYQDELAKALGLSNDIIHIIDEHKK